jgi:hypothetical protein
MLVCAPFTIVILTDIFLDQAIRCVKFLVSGKIASSLKYQSITGPLLGSASAFLCDNGRLRDSKIDTVGQRGSDEGIPHRASLRNGSHDSMERCVEP